jgi:hypothetical protein
MRWEDYSLCCGVFVPQEMASNGRRKSHREGKKEKNVEVEMLHGGARRAPRQWHIARVFGLTDQAYTVGVVYKVSIVLQIHLLKGTGPVVADSFDAE